MRYFEEYYRHRGSPEAPPAILHELRRRLSQAVTFHSRLKTALADDAPSHSFPTHPLNSSALDGAQDDGTATSLLDTRLIESHALREYFDFLSTALTYARRQWTEFNLMSMGVGVLLLAVAVCLLVSQLDECVRREDAANGFKSSAFIIQEACSCLLSNGASSPGIRLFTPVLVLFTVVFGVGSLSNSFVEQVPILKSQFVHFLTHLPPHAIARTLTILRGAISPPSSSARRAQGREDDHSVVQRPHYLHTVPARSGYGADEGSA